MASYKEGERVFAKLSTWPYWPARINKLPDYINVPPGTYPIFFYGTHEVNFLSPKVILPFEENKDKFCRNNRYQYYTEAMWEIENHSDVLCIDKDETAEEFLCDAYGVVKPPKPHQKTAKDQTKESVTNIKVTETLSNETVVTPLTKTTDIPITKTSEKPVVKDIIVPAVKLASKEDNLLGNLEFSDDESEDMTPLYSKLIIIAGSQENDKPDSSSANHEAEALNNNMLSHHIKACWVMVEKLSQVEINKALKFTSEYGPSTQVLSQQCVTTINKETRVIDTIIIDSDDNQSSVILLTPERIIENKYSDIMPKSKQISIPRWPKPLFEKVADNLRTDKVNNPTLAKKPLLSAKEKSDKKEKRDRNEEKKVQKEIKLSFDNLFNKKLNVLGSGFKIAKKVSNVAPVVITEPDNNDSDDSKDEVIDLVLEFDDIENVPVNPPVTKVESNDEDDEAEKWCKAQNWGNDDVLDDIGVLEECGADDDDESNSSWTKPSSKDKSVNEKNVIEIEDDDVEFMDMVDLTRTRRREKYPDHEEMMEEDNVQVITGDEVVETGEDFVEDFEDGFTWRPIEPDECNGRGKWFEIDKLNYCNSPPRFSDLVEKKVIKPPEVEPIYTDRFYDLWADSKPKRNNQNHCNISYANRFNSPYKNQVHSPPVYPQISSQRDPRVAQRNNNTQSPVKYCDTDRPNESNKSSDKSMDVWRRHIELKTKRNNFVKQENTFMPHENRFVPQENNFIQQRSKFSSGIRPFVNIAEDYQRDKFDHPTRMHNSHNVRNMYQQYPYPGVTRSYFPPIHPYYNDPRIFYEYYKHLMSQGGNNRMNTYNKAPVPYTPESPDPEMMDDYDPSQYIVKKESTEVNDLRTGLNHPYYQNNHNNMFTPASPDPIAVESPSEGECEEESLRKISKDIDKSEVNLQCPSLPSSEYLTNNISQNFGENKVNLQCHSLLSPEYLAEIDTSITQVRANSILKDSFTVFDVEMHPSSTIETHVDQDVLMSDEITGSDMLSKHNKALTEKTTLECSQSYDNVSSQSGGPFVEVQSHEPIEASLFNSPILPPSLHSTQDSDFASS